tara:strand:+ start:195 stop:371 length:177 start_codon:yes stop_codon:yes gene_type:complete
MVAAFVVAALHMGAVESSHQVQVVDLTKEDKIYECVLTLSDVYNGDAVKFCNDTFKEL